MYIGIYTGSEGHQDQGAGDHPAQGGGYRDIYRDTLIYTLYSVYKDTGIYIGSEDHQDQGAADHPAQGGGYRNI